MTTRQRFAAVMNFEPFDRLPIVEWAGWWDKTIQRWHSEGLPRNLTDRYDICRHLGLELYLQDWIRARRPDCPVPSEHGGAIIGDMDDYLRVRQHLFPENVLDRARWSHWRKLQEAGEVVIWLTLDGFFWFPRTLLGIERHLYAFYDQPELMHRINSDLARWMIRVYEQVADIVVPDFMTIAEDMSYNHGPMISRSLFDEFCKPYYQQVLPRMADRGTLVLIDSDGDVTEPLAWFEQAGLDGLLPLERQAGVDMAELRARYPRMRFIGHFDKMVMSKGESAIAGEFERLLPVAAQGGWIVSCDHQTPPGVSYDDYRLYLRLFREYAAEAGRLSRGESGSRPSVHKPGVS